MKKIHEALIEFENAIEEINNFIEEKHNESDTRSKIIDCYLVKILGWSEKDIKREGHLDSGYFDYKISCPAISFVIEAKKVFKEFVLPSGHNKTKFKTIYKENIDVISQIRSYCGDIGLQYGIITNGKQFIIGKKIDQTFIKL